MESRTQKRMRPLKNFDSRDRLSEMPDEVIIHILSCMPIVYAVRTMLLRRFGDLWTLVHTLKLDMLDFRDHLNLNHQCKEDENERMFVFVRYVLILHRRPSINKFHIHVAFRSSDEYDKASGEVKTWVRFALGRQAKELILCDTCEYEFFADLSVRNFTSQSLVTLLLDSCNLETLVEVNLPSLKKLSINYCVIRNEELQRFICGCPSLQELEIKNLAVPKLSYGKLDGVEVLHLSHYVSHELLAKVQHLDLLQHKWKRVVLELWKFDQVCPVGILHLMRSLRNLEELTIYTTIGFEASADLPPLEDSSPYATPQLKNITLHGYGKTLKSQLRLVEFLLKGAAVLDKLIIVTTKHPRYPGWNAKPAEELEFVKLVSSFPRASTSARVLFA